MSPLPFDWGTIEFETPNGVLDLHNNAVFEQARYVPRRSTLVFEFRYAADWRDLPERADETVLLEFADVHRLSVAQAGDFDPRSADTFEGIGYREADGESWFTLMTGDSKFTFTAAGLRLRRIEEHVSG